MIEGETASRAEHRSWSVTRVLVVISVAVALTSSTGCLTSTADVVVNSDGSGEVVIEVTPPVVVAGSLTTMGVEQLADQALEGIDGASFEKVERLGQPIYILRIPFEDHRQLTDNLLGGATVAGQRLAPFSQFDLRELPDGAGWALTAVLEPLAQIAQFSDDELGRSLATILQLAGTDEAGAGLRLKVTLPGRVISSNAGSVEGGTATWDFSDPNAPNELRMTTESVPLLTPLQWVLVGTVGIFVLGALLMFVGAAGPARRWGRRSRRKGAESTRPGGGSWQPPARERTQNAESRPSGPAPDPQLPSLASHPPQVSATSPPAPTHSDPWVPQPPTAAPGSPPPVPATPPPDGDPERPQ